jgi:hypothetical protein
VICLIRVGGGSLWGLCSKDFAAFVFVSWRFCWRRVGRFSVAARGGADAVPGRASMLAVPPSAGLLSGARPGQVAAQLALWAQTCSPSPCLQQGANQTLPARLRRQQGAPPGTASALVTPLVACHDPAAAACGHHLASTTVKACHNLRRWRATSGAKKGWGGIWPGALLVLEARSKEVGTRSVLRELTRRGCLSGAGRARATSSPSPLPCEHRKAVLPQAGPPTLKPGRMPTQPSPCAASTKRQKASSTSELETLH